MNQKPLTLSVLITTLDAGINGVIANLLPQLSKCFEVIISHQITDNTYILKDINLPKNTKYIFEKSIGLSRNRNLALAQVSGDICYICDDDVILKSNFQDIVLRVYENNPTADVMSFEAENELGRKRFGLQLGKHNFYSFLKISSIGITFRRKTIQEKNIMFNEDFGLGTKCPIGEEALFLRLCYIKGCQMFHNSETIVSHTSDSTGQIYTHELAHARIILWKELFGFFGGVFAVFYFLLTHYHLYKKSLGFFTTLRIFMKALFSYNIL